MIFFFLFLAIWTGMNAYVAWRILGVPFVGRAVPRRVVNALVVVLALVWIVGMIVQQLGPPKLGRALEWVGAYWVGSVFVFLTTFFLADLLTGFGLWWKKQREAIRTAAFVAALLLIAISIANAMRAPVVRSEEIAIADLPQDREGTVVAVLSDLHLGTMLGAEWMAARVAQVEAMHPDLIVIAGDIVEGHGPVEPELTAALGRLRAPLGVWAVPGNHERHGSGAADAIMKEAGIRFLRDQWAEAAPGLIIAGVDTVGHDTPPGFGLVERATAGIPPGGATILLAHYPEQTELAVAKNVGLMISGHTHAGQIWPFNYFVRGAYRYVGGIYEVDGMPLLVCRGTGTWGPRMRLWRPSEMWKVTLRRK